jgi:GntR family transcriptional regulator
MARFRVIEGPVPLHHQVYLDLRDALDAGEWTPGDRLPPERELAERYGVSLITVRRALTDLARERRLERTRGRGTVVTRPPIPLDLDAPVSFMEEIRRLGHAPATRIVTARTMAAEPAVADPLGIAHGAQVVHLERLRMADGAPMLLEQVYLPEARFPGLLAGDLEQGSLYELLAERYGTNVVRAREALEPVAIPAREAHLLGVEPGRPALRIEGLAFDDGVRPVELALTFVRGDRTRYSMERVVTRSATHDEASPTVGGGQPPAFAKRRS